MIKGFDKLNIYHKCSVLSGLFILLLSLCLIPLYFFGYMDIALGFILGGAYGILVYCIVGLLENNKPEYYRWAITVTVFRFLLFAVMLFLVGLCYYKWEIKIFNIFSVVGGYLICLVVLIVLFILNGKKERGL